MQHYQYTSIYTAPVYLDCYEHSNSICTYKATFTLFAFDIAFAHFSVTALIDHSPEHDFTRGIKYDLQ